MLELKIKCESPEEARVYLNAHQYLNLLSDFYAAVRNAKKHGTDQDVLKTVDMFEHDFISAIDNSEGAY
jgi:hypothetical protein